MGIRLWAQGIWDKGIERKNNIKTVWILCDVLMTS